MRTTACWAALLYLVAGAALADVPAGRAAIEGGDYATAQNVLRPLADQGDPEANLLLGRLAEHGWGAAKSDAAAWAYYKRGADRGSVEAMVRAADFASVGRGVPLDYRLAYGLYKRAAEAGDARARGRLAQMTLEGRGRKVNYVQGLAWLQQAAAEDDPEALASLDDLVARGRARPLPAGSSDPAEAVARRILAEIRSTVAELADHLGPGVRLSIGGEVTVLTRSDGSVLVTLPQLAVEGESLALRSGPLRLVFREVTEATARVDFLLPSRFGIEDAAGARIGSVLLSGQRLSGAWSFAWHGLTDCHGEAGRLAVDLPERMLLTVGSLVFDRRFPSAGSRATLQESLVAGTLSLRAGSLANGVKASADEIAWRGELRDFDQAAYARWARAFGSDWRSGPVHWQILLAAGRNGAGVSPLPIDADEQIEVSDLTSQSGGNASLALHRLAARTTLTGVEPGLVAAHLSYSHDGWHSRPEGLAPDRIAAKAELDHLPLDPVLRALRAWADRTASLGGTAATDSAGQPASLGAALALAGTRLHLEEASFAGDGWDASASGGVAPTAGGLALAADVAVTGLDRLLQEKGPGLGPSAVLTLRQAAKPGPDGAVGHPISRLQIVLPPSGRTLVNGVPLALYGR